MNEHYEVLKAQYPRAILFFQVGDTYEVYGDDAIKMAEVLCVQLEYEGEPVFTIRRSWLDRYVSPLIEAGHTVAIADRIDKAPRDANVETIVHRRELKVEPDGDILWL